MKCQSLFSTETMFMKGQSIVSGENENYISPLCPCHAYSLENRLFTFHTNCLLGKNTKNTVNLSFAELARLVVKVSMITGFILSTLL